MSIIKETTTKPVNLAEFQMANLTEQIYLLNRRRTRSNIVGWMIKITGYFFLLVLLATAIFVTIRAGKFLHEEGFRHFFNRKWDKNEYGVGNALINTGFILLIVFAMAIPLTIFTALFINEYLPKNLRSKVQGFVKVLAGIPSVVFGMFGLQIVSQQFLQKLPNATEGSAQTSFILTCLILTLMILPIMIALTLDALQGIPNRIRYSANALGLKKEVYCFNLLLKLIWVRVLGAFLLGIARVIGETMAVLMISGNDPNGLDFHNGITKFLYSQVATLAGLIGFQILESTTELQTSALYAVGLLLFILVLVLNLLVLALSAGARYHRRHRRIKQIKRTNGLQPTTQSSAPHALSAAPKLQTASGSTAVRVFRYIVWFFLISSTLIVIFSILMITGSVVIRGVFLAHWADFTAIKINKENGTIPLLPSFLVTILLLLLTLFLVVPIAVVIAWLLTEYLKKKGWGFQVISLFLNVFASTPSIIYGLFGLYFFIFLLHMPLSILVGALTLSLLILPMLVRNISDAFLAVPRRLRNASLALGVTKSRTNINIVLRESLPATTTAVLLAAGRAIGESAPVYLTLGTTVALPNAGFLSPGAAMSTHILSLWRTGADQTSARAMYELAALIMLLIWSCWLINTAVRYYFKVTFLGRKPKKVKKFKKNKVR